MTTITLTVNGSTRTLEVTDSQRLLDILREDLRLTGTKEGCGIGECGACTVILDGRAANACLVLACQLDGAHVQTIEALERDQLLSRLQQAFLEHGAVQCGYCTPGMLMSAKALLDQIPNPSEEQIKTAIEGNLCRCTGYRQILTAVKSSANHPVNHTPRPGTAIRDPRQRREK